MTVFTKPGPDVFAGFDVAGNARKVDNHDAQVWSAEVEAVIDTALAGGGSLIYDTRANLYADLAHDANSSAWVIDDGTVANNGVYRKIGASGAGSWTRIADLPYSFVRLIDAGAGTPNAIQVTSTIPTSASVMRVAKVFEANTGNVTISENGGAAKALLTAGGNQVAAAGLVAGMMIVYVDDGTAFRLLTDQASAAIQAAAETAQAAAEAAAADAIAAAASVDIVSASGDTTGAADLAALDALIGVKNKITLAPGATYYLASKWTIDSAVDLYLNGATIQAKSGFTDGQLITGTASGIRIHGPGKIDGTNLPDITADFIGTVFTGITVFVAQNQSTPLSSTNLTGVAIDGDVEILSGSCGSLAAYSCPGISVRATADGSALNATYQGAALFFIVKCDNSNTDLRIKNRKWKGVSYSSCNGGISNAIVENAASAPSGFAGVHATSSSCMVMDASIKGGFGFKTDSCLDMHATVAVDCNSTGLGGVVLQGGQRNKVRGIVKNFTGYGCAIANDATGNAVDHDVDLIMSCATSPGDGSIVGYSLSGASSMGIAGLKLSGTINTVDIAVKSADADTTPVMGNIDITALRLYNIKNYLGYGPFGSLHVVGGSAIDCSGLTDGWRLWSGLSGKEITFDGFVMRNCGTAANLLTLDTTVGAIQLNRVSINGGGADGSGGLMKLNIASASYYVKSLSLTGFDGTNLSIANAASLTSLSTTVIALLATGNKLLSTDYSTRRAINLSATAKFKGLCAETNNLATVPTAPTAP